MHRWGCYAAGLVLVGLVGVQALSRTLGDSTEHFWTFAACLKLAFLAFGALVVGLLAWLGPEGRAGKLTLVFAGLLAVATAAYVGGRGGLTGGAYLLLLVLLVVWAAYGAAWGSRARTAIAIGGLLLFAGWAYWEAPSWLTEGVAPAMRYRHEMLRLRTLLALGTDPNRADRAGQLPFYFALRWADWEKPPGGDYWVPAGRPGTSTTGFPNAAAVLDTLLKHGADVNRRDHTGRTALHWAAERGVAVAWVMQRGCHDVNARDDAGNTPLHYAARQPDPEAVRYLVDLGAEVDARNKRGETPLWLAAYCGCTGTVRYLADHGADARAQDNGGDTPLHMATCGAYAEVAKLLLKHGANVNAKDAAGETPLGKVRHEANSAAHYAQTIALLRQHGGVR